MRENSGSAFLYTEEQVQFYCWASFAGGAALVTTIFTIVALARIAFA